MIRTLQISFLIIYALGITGLMSFIIIKNSDNLIPSIDINIFRETKIGFLDKEDLLITMNNFQDLDSIKVNQLRISKLELELLEDPYIKSVDAFTNIQGRLIVNISEKNPVVRIFNKKASGYYLTESGDILPLSNKYSARVFMVNGYLNIPFVKGFTNVKDTVYKNTTLKGILELSNTLAENEFLKSQINQIYINSKLEFELIPEFGNHTIIVGDLKNLDKKLQKLEAFYKQALLEEGIDKYKTINLKFDDQLVCTKK